MPKIWKESAMGLSTLWLFLSRRIDRVGLKLKPFIVLITMAHHGKFFRERVIALAEDGGLGTSTAGELCGVSVSAVRAWLQKCRCDMQVGRRRETVLWRVSSPAQDAALVAEAHRNPFFSAMDLKAATGFPGQKTTLISRLKNAGLRARHAAVMELLSDDHNL